MIRIISLLGLIFLTTSGFSQKLVIKNNTGETIKAIVIIEKDSLVKDFDSLIGKNQLSAPLKIGESITLNAKNHTYHIYAFTDNELQNANCYFVPFWSAKKKQLTLTKDNLESEFGGGEIVSADDDDWPRVLVKIINQTNVQLFSIYYKPHASDKYVSNSIIKSWDPIILGETRNVFFYPPLKKIKDEKGEISYEGFIDFKIVGFTDQGEAKTFLIDNFDCVNKEDIIIR